MGEIIKLDDKNPMEFVQRQLCLTKEIGIRNNLFGGEMLSWLDKAMATWVMEKTDTPDVVTKHLEVEFVNPVKIKNIVHFYARVQSIGNTSIKCDVEIRKHDVETGKDKIVGRAIMTFVKVDSDGV
jgi:acyl-CoA thioesterase YciA